MPEEKKSKEYLDLWKELDDNFSHWKSLYLDIRDYVLPRRGKFIDLGQSAEGGETRHGKILDGTASRALRFGAAGIHGNLTSPARPWFRLLPPELGMMKSSGVRQWLQHVERIMYAVYAKTNFYQCVHTIYQEEMGFGTGVLLQEEDILKVCRFTVLTAGEYRLATNTYGEVDTVARLFYMTARQMIQKFTEEKVSRAVKDAMKDSPNKSFKVLHIVKPNSNRDPNKIDSGNLPFESTYIEYENDQGILMKKGYNENPFTCPRWDIIANESYGVAPAHDLLGEIKTLQVMRKDVLSALHKTIDPPMNIPTTMKDTFTGLPGGHNWVDPGSQETVKPTYQIQFDIQSTKQDIKEIQQDVKEGFYNDLFLMLSQSPGIQPKNMMEIAELQEEKLIMLGPVIERQFTELLNPVIARTFAIMWRMGLIPPPPPEIQGAEIKVEYVSFLAQAQKKIGIQAINATMAFAGNYAQLFPDILDKVDVDEAIDAYAEVVGSPQQIIRSKDKVDGIRQARQKQQEMLQMQQMTQTMGDVSKSAKQLSDADTEGKNALTDMLKSAGMGNE